LADCDRADAPRLAGFDRAGARAGIGAWRSSLLAGEAA
jgi:hypothetical protein